MSSSQKNRGFVLNRQRVLLDIDFAGTAKGTTQLYIRPTETWLQTVYLHAAPCLRISEISLSSTTVSDPLPEVEAHYVHLDPLRSVASSSRQPLSSTTSTHNPTHNASSDPPSTVLSRHPAIKRQLWTAMACKEEGELAIDVSHGWVRIAKDEQGKLMSHELAEICITIDYEIVIGAPQGSGIVWRRPGDDGNDERVPHVFLNSAGWDAARHWVPCVDSLWERSQWDLRFIVPRSLAATTVDESGGGPSSERVYVVSSGELEDTVSQKKDSPNFWLVWCSQADRDMSLIRSRFLSHNTSSITAHSPLRPFQSHLPILHPLSHVGSTYHVRRRSLLHACHPCYPI